MSPQLSHTPGKLANFYYHLSQKFQPKKEEKFSIHGWFNFLIFFNHFSFFPFGFLHFLLLKRKQNPFQTSPFSFDFLIITARCPKILWGSCLFLFGSSPVSSIHPLIKMMVSATHVYIYTYIYAPVYVYTFFGIPTVWCMDITLYNVWQVNLACKV